MLHFILLLLMGTPPTWAHATYKSVWPQSKPSFKIKSFIGWSLKHNTRILIFLWVWRLWHKWAPSNVCAAIDFCEHVKVSAYFHRSTQQCNGCFCTDLSSCHGSNQNKKELHPWDVSKAYWAQQHLMSLLSFVLLFYLILSHSYCASSDFLNPLDLS